MSEATRRSMRPIILLSTVASLMLMSTAAAQAQAPPPAAPQIDDSIDAAEAQAPPAVELRIYDIVHAASAERIEDDIRVLADFGTRHTMSDTVSDVRRIGAARRWIRDEFERISADCGGCLEVFEQRYLVRAGEHSRIPEDTWVVNVVAIQRGALHPDRYVIMTGDIDSRATDVMDGGIDAPGANDSASGMAGTLEAARILSQYEFPTSIV